MGLDFWGLKEPSLGLWDQSMGDPRESPLFLHMARVCRPVS